MFTRKESLAQAIVLAKASKNDELVESLEHMLSVESRVRKESPKQIENKAIAERIVEFFSANPTPLTIGELIEVHKADNIFGECKEPINNQRISRICKNLVDEGKMQKLVERRVSLFTVAE